MALRETAASGSGWKAEILPQPPLIAPARQYVWPMRIAGEEDALARGAVLVQVRPSSGGSYLVTCALGFRDPSMPTGVWACPHPEQVCVVAGGYAYIANVQTPESCTQVALKPVADVCRGAGLLLFVGFHTIVGWGRDGKAWETARLSWEGVRVVSVDETQIKGFGWDLRGDEEVEFTVDLGTGRHSGGGFRV